MNMLTFSLLALVLLASTSTVTCHPTLEEQLPAMQRRLDVLENYHRPPLQNVARFRPTSQSSTHTAPGGPAISMRAVDGNYDTNYYRGLSCTHTEKEAGRSWWQVDLEGFYNISSVSITNRDCCAERLRDVVITVHNGDPRYFSRAPSTLCAHRGASFPAGVTTWFDCQRGPIRGRYVRITNAPNEFLELCEVEVMAVPVL